MSNIAAAAAADDARASVVTLSCHSADVAAADVAATVVAAAGACGPVLRLLFLTWYRGAFLLFFPFFPFLPFLFFLLCLATIAIPPT